MLRVAIVDDEVEQQDLLEEDLRRYGQEQGETFQIARFSDAQTFLGQDSQAFDLALLDIQMPGLDGVTLSRRLREQNQNIILIFITNMAQFAIEGYAVDAMDFILKPVSYYRLATSLTKARNRLSRERGANWWCAPRRAPTASIPAGCSTSRCSTTTPSSTPRTAGMTPPAA